MDIVVRSFEEFYEIATLAKQSGAKGVLMIMDETSTRSVAAIQGEVIQPSPTQRVKLLLMTDIGSFRLSKQFKPHRGEKFEEVQQLEELRAMFKSVDVDSMSFDGSVSTLHM